MRAKEKPKTLDPFVDTMKYSYPAMKDQYYKFKSFASMPASPGATPTCLLRKKKLR
jgi:hypothetical protein